MRCYLVRHAQTAWNGENRLQGHSDPPLSPVGEAQARCLAEYFLAHHQNGTRVTAVYTSGLVRSQQTAQAIAGPLGIRPVVEPRLAEMHLGRWEGLTPEEIDAQFDGAYQQWMRSPSGVVIPEAEPLEQFRTRVGQAFARILATAPTGDVVIVSHGGVIATWLSEWLNADYDRLMRRLSLDNAGISAIDRHTHPPHV